jgi:hypothetical protein
MRRSDWAVCTPSQVGIDQTFDWTVHVYALAWVERDEQNRAVSCKGIENIATDVSSTTTVFIPLYALFKK